MITEIVDQSISQIFSIITYYIYNFWPSSDLGATRIKDIIQISAIIWAYFKIQEFRALKYKIDLEISAHIYKLNEPQTTCLKTYDRQNNNIACSPPTLCTHVAEVLFKFKNKSNRRFRLYNLQATISTMPDEIKIRDDDCGLALIKMLASGNIVPKGLTQEEFDIKERLTNFLLKKRPDAFYYIEPDMEQIITYLCVIPKPKEILQVRGIFSWDQHRLYPQRYVGSKRLFPRISARTYKLDREGMIVNE